MTNDLRDLIYDYSTSDHDAILAMLEEAIRFAEEEETASLQKTMMYSELFGKPPEYLDDFPVTVYESED
jgi:hypothetical protein